MFEGFPVSFVSLLANLSIPDMPSCFLGGRSHRTSSPWARGSPFSHAPHDLVMKTGSSPKYSLYIDITYITLTRNPGNCVCKDQLPSKYRFFQPNSSNQPIPENPENPEKPVVDGLEESLRNLHLRAILAVSVAPHGMVWWKNQWVLSPYLLERCLRAIYVCFNRLFLGGSFSR